MSSLKSNHYIVLFKRPTVTIRYERKKNTTETFLYTYVYHKCNFSDMKMHDYFGVLTDKKKNIL